MSERAVYSQMNQLCGLIKTSKWRTLSIQLQLKHNQWRRYGNWLTTRGINFHGQGVLVIAHQPNFI